MRIAALYDIHGNPFALRAVINDIKQYAVDLVVIGGDAFTGPLPSETLYELTRIPLPTHFITGNAETELQRCLAGETIGGLSAYSEHVTRWIATQLTNDQRRWINSWTPTFTLHLPHWGTILFCHSTPQSNQTIFTADSSAETLSAIVQQTSATLIVCGHSHVQADITFHHQRIVNAGSVGMATGNTGADWLMLDDTVHFMHTDYDIYHAAQLMQSSRYPGVEAFIEHHLLTVPSREQMNKMLTALALTHQSKER